MVHTVNLQSTTYRTVEVDAPKGTNKEQLIDLAIDGSGASLAWRENAEEDTGIHNTQSVLENLTEQANCTLPELLSALKLLGDYSPDTLIDAVTSHREGNA